MYLPFNLFIYHLIYLFSCLFVYLFIYLCVISVKNGITGVDKTNIVTVDC